MCSDARRLPPVWVAWGRGLRQEGGNFNHFWGVFASTMAFCFDLGLLSHVRGLMGAGAGEIRPRAPCSLSARGVSHVDVSCIYLVYVCIRVCIHTQMGLRANVLVLIFVRTNVLTRERTHARTHAHARTRSRKEAASQSAKQTKHTLSPLVSSMHIIYRSISLKL